MQLNKNATSYIEIVGLRIYANHGVDLQESVVGNLFEVTVKLYYDSTQAMLTDSIIRAVSYADVVKLVKNVMASSSNLLENVVYRLHMSILRQFPQVTSGEIKLSKIAPPISAELDRVTFGLRW